MNALVAEDFHVAVLPAHRHARRAAERTRREEAYVSAPAFRGLLDCQESCSLTRRDHPWELMFGSLGNP